MTSSIQPTGSKSLQQMLPSLLDQQSNDSKEASLLQELEALLGTLEETSTTEQDSKGSNLLQAASNCVQSLPNNSTFATVKADLTTLLAMCANETVTADEFDQQIATVKQSATTMMSALVSAPQTTAPAPTSTASAPTTSTDSTSSNSNVTGSFNDVLTAMTNLGNLEAYMAQVDVGAYTFNATATTQTNTLLQTDEKNADAALDKAKRAAKHHSFWSKITLAVGIVAAVIGTAISFGTLGPVAALMVAGLAAGEYSGGFNKMFSFIPAGAGRDIAEFAFCGVVALTAGGMSGALDLSLQAAAEEGTEEGTEEASTSVTSKVGAALSQGKTTAVSIGMQSLFTVNPINNAIMTSKWGKDHPGAAEGLCIAITIVGTVASGFALSKMGATATTEQMVNRLDTASESATGVQKVIYNGAKLIINTLRNPWVISGLTAGSQAAGATSKGMGAHFEMVEADAMFAYAPVQASITQLQQTMQTMSSSFQSISANPQTWISEISNLLNAFPSEATQASAALVRALSNT